MSGTLIDMQSQIADFVHVKCSKTLSGKREDRCVVNVAVMVSVLKQQQKQQELRQFVLGIWCGENCGWWR